MGRGEGGYILFYSEFGVPTIPVTAHLEPRDGVAVENLYGFILVGDIFALLDFTRMMNRDYLLSLPIWYPYKSTPSKKGSPIASLQARLLSVLSSPIPEQNAAVTNDNKNLFRHQYPRSKRNESLYSDLYRSVIFLLIHLYDSPDFQPPIFRSVALILSSP